MSTKLDRTSTAGWPCGFRGADLGETRKEIDEQPRSSHCSQHLSSRSSRSLTSSDDQAGFGSDSRAKMMQEMRAARRYGTSPERCERIRARDRPRKCDGLPRAEEDAKGHHHRVVR